MKIPDLDIPDRIPALGLRVDNFALPPDVESGFHSHSHENIEINFLERGSVTYIHCNRTQAIPEGQTGIFWAGYPHRIFSGDKVLSMWWITIPMEEFFAWRMSRNFVHRLMSGELVLDRVANPELELAMIRRWHREQTHPIFRPIILLELQARLKRIEAQMAPSPLRDVQSVGGCLSFLHPAAVKMAAFLTENFQESLTLDQVAGVARLNPCYAARLFKKNFGHSIGDFLREVRVSHAIHLIRNTPSKVLDVAFDCGFQSGSRFYEAFKAVTGRRPNDFRAPLPHP